MRIFIKIVLSIVLTISLVAAMVYIGHKEYLTAIYYMIVGAIVVWINEHKW